MPLYRYICSDCDKEQTIMHSMTEKDVICRFCESKDLKKIFKTMTKPNKEEVNATGELVKEYIRDSKEDLKQQMKDLRNREYK
tara:strand:- start:28895 stop:29143 length:249 start_codon:yes stop_codon:yes gene_type:complete